MAERTGIEWTDATWNPVTGCTKVSPGCDHCYADSIAHRFAGTPAYPNGFQVTLRPERLDQPLRWRRPRRIFVNSMSDLFHRDVPTDYIARVFAVMSLATQHTFQVLTKRPGRMRSLLNDPWFVDTLLPEVTHEFAGGRDYSTRFPSPNVWLGVSVEDQKWADVRIPLLARTPAAVRFLSMEPLLGPVTLCDCYLHGFSPATYEGPQEHCRIHGRRPIDWVIVGGESGAHARPMDPEWVRSLRDECASTYTPAAFFFKQWGGRRPKENGNELDGRTWQQFPGTGHG